MFVDETLNALRDANLAPDSANPATSTSPRVLANLLERIGQNPGNLREATDKHQILNATMDLITAASIYVFEPSALDTIHSLASNKLLANQRQYLRLPNKMVWFEWCGVMPEIFGPHSDRRGVLLWPLPEDESQWSPHVQPTRGCITVFQRDPRPRPDGSRCNHISTLNFDFAREEIIYAEKGETRLNRTGGAINTTQEQYHLLGRWLTAAIVLRNTPRVIEVRDSELTKVNRARARSNKPLLLPYTQIFVPLVAAAARRAGSRGGGEGTDEASVRRRRHEVDAFFRMRLGQVELVRSHWRGDESLGTVKTIHHLT